MMSCPFEFRGEIEKEGSWIRSWKQRACLFRHGVLHYAEKDPKSPSKLGAIKGYVNVCGGIVDAVSKAVHNRDHMLACADAFGRRLAFQAPSEQHLQSWLTLLRGASRSGVSGDGWLDKRASPGSGSWKRRFCRVRGCRLYWCKSKSDPPLGEVDLLGCKISELDVTAGESGEAKGAASGAGARGEPFNAVFTVSCQLREDPELASDPVISKPRSLQFRAPTEEMGREWMAWLRRASERPLVPVEDEDDDEDAAAELDGGEGREDSGDGAARGHDHRVTEDDVLARGGSNGEVESRVAQPGRAEARDTKPVDAKQVGTGDITFSGQPVVLSPPSASERPEPSTGGSSVDPLESQQDESSLEHQPSGSATSGSAGALATAAGASSVKNGETGAESTSDRPASLGLSQAPPVAAKHASAASRTDALDTASKPSNTPQCDGGSEAQASNSRTAHRSAGGITKKSTAPAAPEADPASKSTPGSGEESLPPATKKTRGKTKPKQKRLPGRLSGGKSAAAREAEKRIQELEARLAQRDAEASTVAQQASSLQVKASQAQQELMRAKEENERMKRKMAELERAAKAAQDARTEALSKAAKDAEAAAAAEAQLDEEKRKAAVASLKKGGGSAARRRKGAGAAKKRSKVPTTRPASKTEPPVATATQPGRDVSRPSLSASQTIRSDKAVPSSAGADRFGGSSGQLQTDGSAAAAQGGIGQSPASLRTASLRDESTRNDRVSDEPVKVPPRVAASQPSSGSGAGSDLPPSPEPPPPPAIIPRPLLEPWAEPEDSSLRSRMKERLATLILERVPPPAPGRDGVALTEKLAVAVPQFAARAEKLCFEAAKAYGLARARALCRLGGDDSSSADGSAWVSAAWQREKYEAESTLEARARAILYLEMSPQQLGAGSRGVIDAAHAAEIVARAAHTADKSQRSGDAGSMSDKSSAAEDMSSLVLQFLGLSAPSQRKTHGHDGSSVASSEACQLAVAMQSCDELEVIQNTAQKHGDWGGTAGSHPRDLAALTLNPLRHFPRRLEDGESPGQLQGCIREATLSLKSVLERRPAMPPNLPALNKWQGRRCASCGVGITTGMFGTATTSACYCWYTELLLCPPCFRGGPCTRPAASAGRAAGASKSEPKTNWRTLPWRMLHRIEPPAELPSGASKKAKGSKDKSTVSWALPVCAQAARFIDKICKLPIVEVSLWAPHLFFGPGGPPSGCKVDMTGGGRAGHLIWRLDPRLGAIVNDEDVRGASAPPAEVLDALKRVSVSRLASNEESLDEPGDDYLTCLQAAPPFDAPTAPQQPHGDPSKARERRRRRLASAPRHLQTMRRMRRQLLRAALALAQASDVSEDQQSAAAVSLASDALAVALVVALARGSGISLPRHVVMHARAGASGVIGSSEAAGGTPASTASDLESQVGRPAASILARFPADKVPKAVRQVSELVSTLCSHEERLALTHLIRACTGVLNPPLGDAAAALADRLPQQCVLPPLPPHMRATVRLPQDLDESRSADSAASLLKAQQLHAEVAGKDVVAAESEGVVWASEAAMSS